MNIKNRIDTLERRAVPNGLGRKVIVFYSISESDSPDVEAEIARQISKGKDGITISVPKDFSFKDEMFCGRKPVFFDCSPRRAKDCTC